MKMKNPQMINNLDNELWRYALEVYSSNEVRECLHVFQDEFGLNINSILSALFAASQANSLPVQFWQKHASELKVFEMASQQARTLRRKLSGENAELYEQAKQHELFLEQWHLAFMAEKMQCLNAGVSASAMDNVLSYCSAVLEGEVDPVLALVEQLMERL